MNKKSGYIKYFSDGQCEYIFDKDAEEGKASWRRGRLSNICAVKLIHPVDDFSLEVCLYADESDWWQADTYVATTEKTELIARRIERRFLSSDVGKYLVYSIKDNVHLFMVLPFCPPTFSIVTKIKEEHKNKWLHLILHLGGDPVGHFNEPTLQIAIMDNRT